MNDMIAWIAAEAEQPEIGMGAEVPSQKAEASPTVEELAAGGMPAHSFPGRTSESELQRAHDVSGSSDENPHPSTSSGQAFSQTQREVGHPAGSSTEAWTQESRDDERERRIYRGRTVAMLRRYLRYSIETGRVPSLLGAEFFRTRVTAYTVVTFEDRVIFVHDMEACLERLDEFSRQLIARHVLQEHDQLATSKLLHCSERTVRTYAPVALDLLSEILLEKGLMDRLDSDAKKSCQGGLEDENSVSDWECGKNKF
jgi:hypothetical protein